MTHFSSIIIKVTIACIVSAIPSFTEMLAHANDNIQFTVKADIPLNVVVDSEKSQLALEYNAPDNYSDTGFFRYDSNEIKLRINNTQDNNIKATINSYQPLRKLNEENNEIPLTVFLNGQNFDEERNGLLNKFVGLKVKGGATSLRLVVGGPKKLNALPTAGLYQGALVISIGLSTA